MASAKPELTRDGTMQVTAKEGVDYLKAAGKDTLLEMQGLKEPEKPSVPRDSTMDATAKEGKEFLERNSKSDEVNNDTEQKNEAGEEKPNVPRDNTMEATAKEGQSLLAGSKIDPDAATRGQQKKLEEIQEEEDAPPAKKARLSKATTMVNTAKEAKGLLGDNAPDVDAMTRGQQKKIEDIQAEKPSPKKPKLSKNTTMAATAKEGTALLGSEKLGDTRAVTKEKKAARGAPKRFSTIQKTMEEAKALLNTDNVDATEGRRTRSSSRPKPALKKAGTMQVTAKEGKEFLKRGRKSKKAAEEEEDVEEEEEEEA